MYSLGVPAAASKQRYDKRLCLLVYIVREKLSLHATSSPTQYKQIGVIPQLGKWLVKQESSENDGRSDVYDRSEFKVVSNCSYPKSVFKIMGI